MTQFSLYKRFLKEGTLTEDKVPNPQYALPSTVHWMRAIAILVKENKLDFAHANEFFVHVTNPKCHGLRKIPFLNTCCLQYTNFRHCAR